MTFLEKSAKPLVSGETKEKYPELLAPAGNFASLEAAIAYGADAVYLGATKFSARKQAGNFNEHELIKAVELAHDHGLFVYLALNTLIHDDEMSGALEQAERAAVAGVDALILQDTGLAAQLRKGLPDLPIHASTQMSISDQAGLVQASLLGFSRVILARELQLNEVMKLNRDATDLGLETEVFLHGALCMSMSGQCLLSSLNGGRSGNRGACAQPCRLPWKRAGWPTNADTNAEKSFPWLSPCDQAYIEGLPDLIHSGVAALKIEGRMRRADYVGQVVAVYRQLIDLDRKGMCLSAEEADLARQRLLVAYNRGGRFTQRMLTGHMGKDFLAGPDSGHAGLLIGSVMECQTATGRMLVKPFRRTGLMPARGDILAVRDLSQPDHDDGGSYSAPIGKIHDSVAGWLIQGFHPDVMRLIKPGHAVYLMSSGQAEALAREATPSRTQLAITMSTTIEGSTIQLEGQVMNGPLAGMKTTVQTNCEAVAPLLSERLHEQLAKTGGTSFRVVSLMTPDKVSLRIAGVNRLRRDLLEKIRQNIREATHNAIPRHTPVIGFPKTNIPQTAQTFDGTVTAYFHMLPADPDQLPCGADLYLLPILSLAADKASVWIGSLHKAEPQARVMAVIPPSRFGRLSQLLPSLLEQSLSSGVDGYVSNHGRQAFDTLVPFQPQAVRSLNWLIDSTANCFNEDSLNGWLRDGADMVCLSPELTDEARQKLLEKLTNRQNIAASRPAVEVPVYGRMTVMRNAYCPIGCNQPACRRCVQEQRPVDADPGRLYAMTDRRGYTFPLLTHPLVCQSELLQHDHLSQISAFVRLYQQYSAHTALFARFSFLEETQQERRELIRHLREQLS